ncbi:MAG: S8 family peptidase [Wenzhouxiangellaceae bacterium]
MHHQSIRFSNVTSSWILGLLLILSAPFTYTGAASADELDLLRGMESAERIPGQFIVVLKENAILDHQQARRGDTREQAVHSLGTELSARYGGEVRRVYTHALTGFLLDGAHDSVAKGMARNPAVSYIQADQMAYTSATQSPVTWGLDRIDQRDLPLDNSFTYTNDGQGVNVYVIDTGIRATHNDFGERVRPGYTAINDGNGTDDCWGHGTHVAGTIGSTTYGVAKNVLLYPARVFGCSGSSPYSTIIAGVDWVAQNHIKPAVVNMSLRGPGDTAMDQATVNLLNLGITVVVAAGNDSGDACGFSPARVNGVLTVGNSTNTDARRVSSNFGECLDLFAPGTDITSTWIDSDSDSHNETGTSMAAPHVAGVAASFLQQNSAASPTTINNAIINAATIGKISNAGTGSPNLLLFNDLTPPPSSPPGVPTNFVPDRLCNGSYRTTWDPPSTGGTVAQYEIWFSTNSSFSPQTLLWTGSTLSKTINVGTSSTIVRYYRVRACNAVGCGGYSNSLRLTGFSGCL